MSGQVFINMLGGVMENTPECGRVYFRTHFIVGGETGYVPIIKFSPSALNYYLDCPLKFYYRYVAGLSATDEVSAW